MAAKEPRTLVAGRFIGSVLGVVAILAAIFIGGPLLAQSVDELPDAFVWTYLMALLATFPTCLIVGWRLISDGYRPNLGWGLFYGSILFYVPLLFWLMKQLSNLGES